MLESTRRSPTGAMHDGMTDIAQSNQIRLLIIATPTPELSMMYFKVRHPPTALTSPTIPP